MPVKLKQRIANKFQNSLKVSKFSITNSPHTAGVKNRVTQNTYISVEFFLHWLFSYTQVSLPFSSNALVHLIPTRSLPVTFCTVQKSKAASRLTTMNVKVELSTNRLRNK